MKMVKDDLYFTEEIEAKGVFLYGSKEIPCEKVVFQRPKYSRDVSLSFDAVLSSNTLQISGISRHSLLSSSVSFSGTLFGRGDVFATCIPNKVGGASIGGEVLEIRINEETLESTPDWQHLQVEFTPTDLAQPEKIGLVRSYTGEIGSMDEESESGNTQLLNTELGDAKFSKYFRYEEVKSHDENLTVQVPVPVLNVTVSDGNLSADSRILIEKCENIVKSFEKVASFLSRRQVRWARIELLSQVADNPIQVQSKMRFIHGTGAPPSPLVNPHKLGSRSIEELVKNLEDSDYKDAVEKAIDFLNGFWNDLYVESSLTNAFVAFEAVINGIGEKDGTDRIIDNHVFKKLQRYLRENIKEWAISKGVNESQRKGICRKIPELQRESIVARAISELDRFEVGPSGSWAYETGLSEELKKIYQRRNKLFHAGKVSDLDAAMVDGLRIHSLCEKLIYRILGAQEEWIAISAYDDLV